MLDSIIVQIRTKAVLNPPIFVRVSVNVKTVLVTVVTCSSSKNEKKANPSLYQSVDTVIVMDCLI
jgi:hypothetical protein